MNREDCDACGNRNLSPYAMSISSDCSKIGFMKKNCIVFILLLISGNINPNPGPERVQLQTPDEFSSSDGLHLVHLNVRSLINKMDLLRVWSNSDNSDIMVFSETRLNKSVTNSMIHNEGYNVFRSDRTARNVVVVDFM